MKIQKRILSMALLICLLCSLLPLSSVQAAPKLHYGLTLDSNGNFMLNGSKFFGYGVNAAAGDIWHDPFDDTYEVCLDTLAKYDIPITRTLITYGTHDDYTAYMNDPDKYFETAKRMLDMAWDRKIGVVVHIISTNRFTSLLGEKPSAIGDMNSKSMAFQIKWTKDMVSRFVDHPAVWGWELGNERNLEADLYQTEYQSGGNQGFVYGPLVGTFNGYDSVTTAEHNIAKREIAKAIRSIDPYRFISSGDAIQREAAYSLYQGSLAMNDKHEWTMRWDKNTLEEWKSMNLLCTPDPTDTISTHFGMALDNFSYILKDKSLSLDELLKVYVDQAKEAKKGFYFGEFGSMTTDANTLNMDLVRDVMPKNLNAMVEAGVQVATLWQRTGNNEFVRDEGPLAYMIQEIQRTNQRFEKAGLHKVDEYWAAVGKATATTSSGNSSSGNSSSGNSSSGNSSSNSNSNSSNSSGSATTIETQDVSWYMRSQSTKLTIVAAENKITLTDAVTLDVFRRSIALRDGYSLKILDVVGNPVTDDSMPMSDSHVVVVSDPNGKEVNRFTISVAEAETTNSELIASDPSTDAPAEKKGNVWIWVIVTVVVLAGGVAVYLSCVKRLLNNRRNKSEK